MITKLLFLGVNCREYEGKKYYKVSFLDNETNEPIKLNVADDDANELMKCKRFDAITVNLRTAQKGYDTILFTCELIK